MNASIASGDMMLSVVRADPARDIGISLLPWFIEWRPTYAATSMAAEPIHVSILFIGFPSTKPRGGEKAAMPGPIAVQIAFAISRIEISAPSQASLASYGPPGSTGFNDERRRLVCG